MTPISKDLALGLSLSRHEFKASDPIKLHIWAYNSGNVSAGVFTCHDLERFKAAGFEIFDDDGRRILSRDELRVREECRDDPRVVRIWGIGACARNIQFKIPAQTCMTRDDYDFAVGLNNLYDLAPGKYFIRIRSDWRKGVNLCGHESTEQLHKQPSDLTFTVTKP